MVITVYGRASLVLLVDFLMMLFAIHFIITFVILSDTVMGNDVKKPYEDWICI